MKIMIFEIKEYEFVFMGYDITFIRKLHFYLFHYGFKSTLQDNQKKKKSYILIQLSALSNLFYAY